MARKKQYEEYERPLVELFIDFKERGENTSDEVLRKGLQKKRDIPWAKMPSTSWVNRRLKDLKKREEERSGDNSDEPWSLLKVTEEGQLMDSKCLAALLAVQRNLLSMKKWYVNPSRSDYENYWTSESILRITQREAKWFSIVYQLHDYREEAIDECFNFARKYARRERYHELTKKSTDEFDLDMDLAYSLLQNENEGGVRQMRSVLRQRSSQNNAIPLEAHMGYTPPNLTSSHAGREQSVRYISNEQNFLSELGLYPLAQGSHITNEEVFTRDQIENMKEANVTYMENQLEYTLIRFFRTSESPSDIDSSSLVDMAMLIDEFRRKSVDESDWWGNSFGPEMKYAWREELLLTIDIPRLFSMPVPIDRELSESELLEDDQHTINEEKIGESSYHFFSEDLVRIAIGEIPSGEGSHDNESDRRKSANTTQKARYYLNNALLLSNHRLTCLEEPCVAFRETLGIEIIEDGG